MMVWEDCIATMTCMEFAAAPIVAVAKNATSVWMRIQFLYFARWATVQNVLLEFKSSLIQMQ